VLSRCGLALLSQVEVGNRKSSLNLQVTTLPSLYTPTERAWEAGIPSIDPSSLRGSHLESQIDDAKVPGVQWRSRPQGPGPRPCERASPVPNAAPESPGCPYHENWKAYPQDSGRPVSVPWKANDCTAANSDYLRSSLGGAFVVNFETDTSLPSTRSHRHRFWSDRFPRSLYRQPTR
jgi:hypothetical protein